jgi:hypothetical protein
MNLQQAFNLIKEFGAHELAAQATENEAYSNALQQQKGKALPPELKLYIDKYCPDDPLSLQGVGNPVRLLAKSELSWQMPGYNLDPQTNQVLSDWLESWFLFGDEGGEPIIVDLRENEALSKVYSAIKGPDGWEFVAIADSIGQFLLCALAIEHAMNFPGLAQPLDEDFNLVGAAGQWFFPFIKKHAPGHYEEWASVFENY